MSKLFKSVAAVIVWLICSAGVAPGQSGLISWWPGEGNVQDATGANNGTESGSLAYTNGKVGQAFSTGGAGPGAAVGSGQIPDAASLRPSYVTLQAWVRSVNPGLFQYIVAKSRTSASPSYALYTAAPQSTGGSAPSGSAGGGFCINSVGGVILAPLADGTRLWDGVWHLLTGTYDGSNARFYVDGTEVGSGTPTSGAIGYATSYQNGCLLIGDFDLSPGRFHYWGDVDEVQLFGRALSAQEVLAAFKGYEPNLLSWWQAEGNVQDSIGTNHGVIHGSISVETGRSGKALNIAGGVVVVADGSALRPGQLTVSAYVRAAQAPGPNKYLLSKSFTASAAAYAFSTGPSGGLLFSVATSNGVVNSPAAPAAIWDDEYHAICGTYDGASVRLYVDGGEIGAGSTASGPLQYGTDFSNGALLFGDFQDPAGPQNFAGNIDEVRLFDRALTAQEISGRTPAPPIVARINPSALSVAPGSKATLTVSTRGPISAQNIAQPLWYQWRKDGADIPGATDAAFTLPFVQSGDCAEYEAVVKMPVVTYVPDGHAGSAFRMTGQLRVPSGPDLEPATQVTVQAWARSAIPPENYRYLASKSFASNKHSYGLYTGSGGIANFYVTVGSGTVVNSPQPTKTIWDGNWHHLTGVYDGSRVRLYVDGVQIGSGTSVSGQPPIAYTNTFQNGDLFLGDFSDCTGSLHYPGDLDEVKIFNRALTATEVLSSYRTQTNAPGLVAWFRGEQNTTDSIGRHHGLTTPPAATVLSEPVSLSLAGPDLPRLMSPASNTVNLGTSPILQATVTSSNGGNLIVTFYGRVAPQFGLDFTLAALPDTQYYVSSENGASPSMFYAQADWIVANRTAGNIAYVAHLGDVVDHGDTNAGPSNLAEWRNATNALYRLENPLTTGLAGGIPYGVAVGNHDQSPNGDASGTTTFFNQFFGVTHFGGRSYYGGHYGTNNNNHFDLFSVSGLDFIVLYFEYDETANPAVLAWANSVLQTNAQRRAIVVSHYLTGVGTPSSFGAQGQAIYNALRANPNLFLMLCGHVGGEGSRQDTFNGNTVYTLLSDYQGDGSGGTGYMRLLQFSPTNGLVTVKTYSPWTGLYLTDADSQFTLPYNLETGTNTFAVLAVTNVPSDATVSTVWPGLQPGTTYQWYATVNDGTWTATGPKGLFTTAPSNSAPIASNLTFNVNGDFSTNLTLTASDPNLDTLTFQFDSLPAHGLLSNTNPANGAFTYTPAHGYSGPDTFAWHASDGQANSSSALACLNVLPPADTNGNNIPDYWEAAYGITDPTGDPDGDGFTNWQEYLANTNPTNSASALRIGEPGLTLEGYFTFTWTGIGGTRYRIEYSDSAANGGFSGVFTEIARPASLEMAPLPLGASSVCRFVDDFSLAGPPLAGCRYYRLKVGQ